MNSQISLLVAGVYFSEALKAGLNVEGTEGGKGKARKQRAAKK